MEQNITPKEVFDEIGNNVSEKVKNYIYSVPKLQKELEELKGTKKEIPAPTVNKTPDIFEESNTIADE